MAKRRRVLSVVGTLEQTIGRVLKMLTRKPTVVEAAPIEERAVA